MAGDIQWPGFAIRAIGAWLLILVCAMANGAFREVVLRPRIGVTWALLVSGVVLSCCVVVVAWFAVARLQNFAARQQLLLGALWLLLTLGFEFAFGRLVQGKAWPELLAAYRFENGNLWPLVLVVVLFAPWAAARLRHRR